MRKTAHWQSGLDERILEHLRDEDWSTPAIMEAHPVFGKATANIIRWRCRKLADVELVAFEEHDEVCLTRKGQEYLRGDLDVEFHPTPRRSRALGLGWDSRSAEGNFPNPVA